MAPLPPKKLQIPIYDMNQRLTRGTERWFRGMFWAWNN